MGKSNYKKVSGGKPSFIKDLMEEIGFIDTPRNCKKFYKKALNKFERRRGKKAAREEQYPGR